LPWSCHFAPLSRSEGEKGKPTGQAAPIGNAGLEPIGPPAGDLGPSYRMPSRAGTGHQGRGRPGMASRTWSPAGSGCSRSAPASAIRHLRRIDQVDGRHLSADGA